MDSSRKPAGLAFVPSGTRGIEPRLRSLHKVFTPDGLEHPSNGYMGLYEVIQSSACLPTEAVPDAPMQSWDVRAAVCAVGSRNIDAHSDEALVFLLHSAVDQRTVDDLFDELFRRYQLRVTRWCYRVTRDPEHVPDLVQEVFLRAFRRLCTYRGHSRFSTWLYVITRNHCLNALKKRHTEPVEVGEMMPDNLPGAHGQEIHLGMERDQSFRNMWRLIEATLTPTEVRVMALHYGHGLSLAVITRQMMLSNPSGAKAYIVNARRKLKAVLRARESKTGAVAYGNRSANHAYAAS
jgi:RNA polymerase sigma-70 factor, ECF subfamily